jgi:pimeloyl-ACP methyl ester carboxylesterase
MSIFKSEAQRAIIRQWYDRFRERIPARVEDREVETSFGRTHALVAGPAGAPPLVVLHGAMASSAHVMGELGPLLSTRRVYAVDVIGQSVMGADRRIDLNDTSYGRWVGETCDGLGLPVFDLYGVSWGAFAALQAARSSPERLRRLVLLVPAGIVGNSFWAGMREAGWPLLVYRMFPSEAHFDRLMRAIFTDIDPQWRAYLRDALGAYKTDMRVPPLFDAGAFAGLRCPVLAFGAEKDASFPGRPLLRRIRELIPHAEVELLEGSRHCPPLTDPFREQMARRIEPFLGTSSPV